MVLKWLCGTGCNTCLFNSVFCSYFSCQTSGQGVPTMPRGQPVKEAVYWKFVSPTHWLLVESERSAEKLPSVSLLSSMDRSLVSRHTAWIWYLVVDFSTSSTECECGGSVGAEAGAVCDGYGGQCSCLEGVSGAQCDVCRNGWFNLTSTGCECKSIGLFTHWCKNL